MRNLLPYLRYDILCGLLCLCCVSSPLTGQAVVDHEAPSYKVGVREAAPFAFRDASGEWQGITIDLWRHIAQAKDLDFEYMVYSLPELLQALEEQSIDVGLAAVTISAEREKRFDFTQPFMQSSLAIAAKAEPAGWVRTLKAFVSWEFFSAAGALAAVILIFGFLIWIFERKKNEQFAGRPAAGIGSGFWWSAVTMTTVGYGDKAPVTLGGRIVGLIWMFAAIIIISGFTAAIASSLTMGSLQSGVESADDLRGARVGAIGASSGAAYLEDARIDYRSYETAPDLLRALEQGQIEAAVHDEPILRYLLKQNELSDVRLLPDRLRLESYAFGLKEGSSLQEPINRALLEVIQSDGWMETIESYLGK